MPCRQEYMQGSTQTTGLKKGDHSLAQQPSAPVGPAGPVGPVTVKPFAPVAPVQQHMHIAFEISGAPCRNWRA